MLQAQQMKGNIDSIKTLLISSDDNGYSWAYCGNINKLFKDDTVVLHSYSKNIAFFSGCQNDTLSIFDFANEKTLISEKSKNNGKLSVSFSSLNSYLTSFRQTKKATFIIFKNYPNIYKYKLLILEQSNEANASTFILTLIKT
jgi:hypothetical protein